MIVLLQASDINVQIWNKNLKIETYQANEMVNAITLLTMLFTSFIYPMALLLQPKMNIFNI